MSRQILCQIFIIINQAVLLAGIYIFLLIDKKKNEKFLGDLRVFLKDYESQTDELKYWAIKYQENINRVPGDEWKDK